LIIGNLPLSGQSVGMAIANHPGGWKYYQAQGFTMGDVPVHLTDVILNLSLGAWGDPAFPPIADLFSDANGFMGTHLTPLQPVIKPCLPCNSREDYVFHPQTPILLSHMRPTGSEPRYTMRASTIGTPHVPIRPQLDRMQPLCPTNGRTFWDTGRPISCCLGAPSTAATKCMGLRYRNLEPCCS
jgi:hypothetical protein